MKSLLLAMLLAQVAPAPLPPVDEPGEVVTMTNAQRAQGGIPPLEIDRGVQASAQQHAEWMAAHGSMTHSDYNGCENIAAGQQSSAAVMSAWMNSRGHRANILRGGVRYMGIGVAVAANGVKYWCFQAAAAPFRILERIAEKAQRNDSCDIGSCERRRILRWRRK